MATKEIIYFEKPGKQNTEQVIEVVKRRAEELGIKHVVVASNSGETALKFSEALKGTRINLVCVTEHAGAGGGDKVYLEPKNREELERRGVKIVMCSHALSGLNRSISNKFGGVSAVEIIAHTLRRFGEGTKVAVEISIMAADCGAIPTDREIISVGGSGGGSDCALVLKPAHMNNFFDLEVREVIAMPRGK